jgi:3-deoxy-D-manno-octulosonic-acid transferase
MAPANTPIVADPNPGFLRAVLHAGYDLAWIAGILVTSPWWIARCVVDRAFRTMVVERMTLRLPAAPGDGRERVLVHGVSVGEVKGAAALVRELEQRRPDVEVVICSTTKTGLEVARQLYPDNPVVRFPLDLSFVVTRFLGRIRPAAVVLVELEIWPNFLRCCNRAGIPVAVVNGRMTPHSFGQYVLFRQTLPQFNRISLFCAQLEEYAERFRSLGGPSERVLVTGNMKADGLHIGEPDAGSLADLRPMLGGRPGQTVVVAGSTHEPEEQLVAAAWRQGVPQARLILVPRHPARAAEIKKQLQATGVRSQVLSRLRAGEAPDPDVPVLVDTIGELEAIYGLADLVFVGGTLVPHGGQNVLEPAAKGRPVVHGPSVENFATEATLLASRGASREVSDAGELARVLRELSADPAARERMAVAGRRAVEEQRGATSLTADALDERCLDGVLATRGAPILAAR